MKKILLVLLIMDFLLPVAAKAEGFATREALRDAYISCVFPEEETVFSEEACTTPPYATGSIAPAFEDDAFAYLNFIRAVAGLSPVTPSALYTDRARRAALLCAANDVVSHTPKKPDDMDEDLYTSAALGAAACNLAQLNWTRTRILRDAVTYFTRDDGEMNLSTLGHRRWVLSPIMAQTGFGLAISKNGLSYAALYAHDLSAQSAWETVCWPCGGVFPADFMRRDIAWSVSFNPDVLLAEDEALTVTLELEGGARYVFSEAYADGYFHVDRGAYGAGPCIIFRPDALDAEYAQNQTWHVRIDGLTTQDGAEYPLEYTVDMVSLLAQEVANVELSDLTLCMPCGTHTRLTANVIPAYADDLSVTWSSSDTAIAAVDEYGLVTAVSAGECRIEVRTANGRSDVCTVTVE